MKCLTVRPPWAVLIVTGEKDIENRTWATPHRGPLLIHAAKGFDPDDYDDWAPTRPDLFEPLGAIIGVVDVVDMVGRSQSKWFNGPIGWSLRGARRFERAIPYRGRLGLFNVPLTPDLVEALARAR